MQRDRVAGAARERDCGRRRSDGTCLEDIDRCGGLGGGLSCQVGLPRFVL